VLRNALKIRPTGTIRAAFMALALG